MNLQQTRWLEHFRRNRLNRPEPSWQAPVDLPPDQIRPLLRSLEQFQLGDGGGPAYLIAWNRDAWLDRVPSRRELVDLWFEEEKEHSRLLGCAVDRFGGRPVDGHWSFSVFCAVRRWGGVGFELTALLLTEISATVYYQLLERHVKDPAIRAMSRLIIRDEAAHIAFHRERLVLPGVAGRRHYGRTWETWFRVLGLAAGTMLWINHRPALVASGATTMEFYRELWKQTSGFITRLRRELYARPSADLDLLGDFLDAK